MFPSQMILNLLLVMNLIKNILLNRNIILVLAVFAGLFFGEYAQYLKKLTVFLLAFVMAFSTTGISFHAIFPVRKSLKIMLYSVVLNYLIFSSVLIFLAWLIFDDPDLFYGFVVIAASPPGVAVIPFTMILHGDMNYSIIGILGVFLISVAVAPLIIIVFSAGVNVSPLNIALLMVKVILFPLLISRLLILKPVYPVVKKIRGQVVNWGFAVIIFIAVGMNRRAFFSDAEALIYPAIILIIALFGLGYLYELTASFAGIEKSKKISQTLILTIKSSGFTATTALALFGEKAALPSAILSIIVLLYLLHLGFRKDLKHR